MKKIFLLFLFVFSIMASAQNIFENKIKENALKLNTATTIEQLDVLFTEFSSLKKQQTANQWKAYYYAGFTLYKKADILLKSGKNGEAGEINAKALKHVLVSEGAQPANNDIKKLLTLINNQKKKVNE